MKAKTVYLFLSYVSSPIFSQRRINGDWLQIWSARALLSRRRMYTKDEFPVSAINHFRWIVFLLLIDNNNSNTTINKVTSSNFCSVDSENGVLQVVFTQSRETQIPSKQITANERSFVYHPPAWRRWCNVKTTYICRVNTYPNTIVWPW